MGGWPTNWKIIVPQKLSHRNESSERHMSLPSLGVWQWEEEPPKNLAWSQEFHGTWGSKLHSWKAHRVLCTPGTREKKQWPRKTLGQTYLLVLEGLLHRQGVAAAAHCRQRHWWQQFCGIFTSGSSPESCYFLTKAWPHLTACSSSAGTPQAKQPTGWEYSSSHQQTGCLKPSWAHSCRLNTLLDSALPIRRTNPAPLARGQEPVPPTRKPEQAS